MWTGAVYILIKKKGLVCFWNRDIISICASGEKKVGDESILINKDLNELKNIDTNFNMITLWHDLEHLVEPKKIVDLIEKKLINKGYVVVEVPNFDSFQHLINKNDWIHLDCPRHVTHFTKKGLFSFFNDKMNKIIKG